MPAFFRRRSTEIPRQPPASFFALGYASLPAEIQIAGDRWQLVRTFKHDFFAVTGLYARKIGADLPMATESPHLAVLKVQRTQPFQGLPLRWLGRLAARHEVAVLKALQGVPGIPTFLGTWGTTGYVHAFIPGEDLRPGLGAGAEFFQALRELLQAVHERHVAYVDTNKRENILYGSDGRPYLIDFQISFLCRRGARDHFLARWLLRRLQAEDWYHYYKHKTRLAPQACTADDFKRAEDRSWYIRAHRRVAQPMIRWRRKLLARYGRRGPQAEVGAPRKQSDQAP